MDKYEFNIKVEQIKKLINKNDYETAMKIADAIDWKRVRNTNLLSLIAQVYEKNAEYQEAKDILLLAFERAPIGKRLLYKLTELALKEGNIAEAEAYYREFCDLSPEDSRQHLLRYMILKEKGAPTQQLIHSLERYTNIELDEKWLYELAELYCKANMKDECVKMCDRIMLMFGLGKYVDKAMELKIQYAPLTSYQMDLVENRDKYEAKLRAVEQEFGKGRILPLQETEEDYDDREETPKTELEHDLAVKMQEVEAEQQLAREMSKISVDDYQEENPMEQTRILADIRSLNPSLESAVTASEPVFDLQDQTELEKKSETTIISQPEEIEEVEEIEELDLEPEPEEGPQSKNHLMIEAVESEKGLQMAIESLKQIHKEIGTKNPVAKITGEKLNKKGIFAVADKLSGKDLIVEQAGDLSHLVLDELDELMSQDTSGMIVVLIDSPKRMESLHQHYPSLASKFEYIGCNIETSGKQEFDVEAVNRALAKQIDTQEAMARESVITQESIQNDYRHERVIEKPAKASAEVAGKEDAEMDLDEFAQYACKYANEIDCTITGKSMLALYERIEIMEEDGIALTKENAELLIEEAADKAEKPSVGRLIKGVFSSKYDKDGLLILKEEHFIN